jgi:hypothetical protein
MVSLFICVASNLFNPCDFVIFNREGDCANAKEAINIRGKIFII